MTYPGDPGTRDGHGNRKDTSSAAGDILFHNGKVFTGVSEHDFVTAFRISKGRIVWVGDSPELDPASGERHYKVVDLGGRTVIPGLLDTHTHPSFMAALFDSVACFPPDVRSLDGMLDVLRGHPALGRGSGHWIMGHGFDESKFAIPVKPTARDLDLVSTDQPVLVRRCDGHTAVCNTLALRLAGITRETPDPTGARIERDEYGEPTGVLVENSAIELVDSLRPVLSDEEAVARLAALDEHFLSRGIVGVNDLFATFLSDDPLPQFRAAERRGFSPQCVLYPGWSRLVARHAPGQVPDLTSTDREGRVKIGGIKLFMDGAFSDRNAWNSKPYPDSCAHGSRVASDDEMREAVAWARRNGVQVAFHAMGDLALDRVIHLFGDESPWLEEVPSIRLDHASLFTPGMIDRLLAARMNFGVISHTIFYFAEYEAYKANLSPAQTEHVYPIRSFYERVPCTALASDAPATAWQNSDDPFISIRAAVERRAYNGADIGQEQAISVPQAILLYTSRAARVSGLDNLGSIVPDAEASFVVLDRDPFDARHDELDRVRVSETWVAGKRRWAQP